MVNKLVMKMNHDIQSTFRDIPCPNAAIKDEHYALAIHLVGTTCSCRCSKAHVPADSGVNCLSVEVDPKFVPAAARI
ncbi:hypothetical protein TNCV_3989721 [Trichonephila clavipes]|uniref:Uncharacterized protein n=1 Tax=Trichonephila clavipes TaxID=2585209 RepID=A0A8X6T7X1_TRICX|nr:hypothetical protein TNCV_3989721 [Trichonephila clavipes]